jgi:hypothetical protein
LGFLAILAPDGFKTQDLEITKCHVNLWSLPGIIRREFFIDVGVRLRVNSGHDLTTVRILLPFGTRPDGFADLRDVLRDQSAAELVFGEPVTIESQADICTIKYRDQVYEIVKVQSGDLLLQGSRDRGESLWELTLRSPIPANGGERYFRVRFEIDNLGNTWNWKHSVLSAKAGALVDLRICDVRQAVSGIGRDLEDSIIPITDLYVFVVIPWRLHLRTASPPLKYLRVLEGRPWRTYLRRATDIRRAAKLVVYYWRAPDPKQTSGKQIGIFNPMLVFLDVSREYGPFSLGNYVFILLVVLIAMVLAPAITSVARLYSFSSLAWIAGIVGLPGITLLGLWRFSNRVRGLLLTFARKIDEVTYAVERWWSRAIGT